MSSPTTAQPLGGTGGEGTPQQEIARFVAAVRAQLDDLSADEVTELTGGLEADLTDALAEETGTPSERYGDPAEYARELRAAAGLPPRSGFGRGAETSAERWRRFLFGPSLRSVPPPVVYREALQSLQEQPWWPAVRDFLVVLRPAWWVLRAWIAVQLFWASAPGVSTEVDNAGGLVRGGFPGLLLLIAAIVISVELGRRSPLPERWQQVLITVGNVIAVIALLPVVSASGSHAYYSSDASSAPSGLSLDGQPVSNVFPYDSQGKLLSGVQLYDQNGHPLEIGESGRSYSNDTGDMYGELVAGSGQGTPPRWNVFPMRARIQDENGNFGAPEQVPAPFIAVPPLIAESSPAPTPTPSSTATPSASPSK